MDERRVKMVRDGGRRRTGPSGPEAEQPCGAADLKAIGEACFALHARMTARILSRSYDLALRPLGLKLTQFGVLGAIGHGESRSETDLAAGLGLERTTLVRNLKILTDKGWIEPMRGGGRGLKHRLTPAGWATLAAAVPLWEEAQKRVEAKLVEFGADEARRAMRALRKAGHRASSDCAQPTDRI
jgi:DNA-binding MarR family transcriptional regulator